MDEKQRKQLERIMRGLDPYKSLDIKSKLEINGIDKMMGATKIIEGMGLRHNRSYDGGLSRLVESTTATTNIDKLMGIARMNNIGQAAIALNSIPNHPVFKPSSSMKAWQSSIERMSRSFTNDYNKMITESVRNIVGVIEELNNGSVNHIRRALAELASSLDSIETFELDEALEDDEQIEDKIDLQEVESIVHTKIEEAKLIAEEQNNDVVIAVQKLTETVEESRDKGGLLNEIVTQALVQIIMAFLVFMYNGLNPYTPTNADIKHTIQATQQIVRTIEIDTGTNICSSIRIVVKDELEVWRSNKRKGKAKYFLDFGDLVQIEHKNKNWTKISYTNAYTSEIETGWVLTRYIKRLD